ncbi:EamA family transporter [halophilic archaeon]|nr:EamA family transporter [halophilic archaeon]
MNLSRYRNTALFALLALVWGTSFTAIETGLEAFPPILFAALRYDIASVAMFAYAGIVGLRRADYQWRPTTRADLRIVAVGGLLVFGLHFALLFVGQRYVTSGVAAVVLSLTPVVTPIFAFVLLPNERLAPVEALGVLLGFAGVVVIARPSPGALDGTLVGVGLLFGSAVAFALGAVLTQRMPTTLPTVPLQAWMMLVGAAVLHAMAAVVPTNTPVSPTPAALASLGYLALAASVGGFLVYFDLLERLGPNEVSLVNYVVPAVATFAGWLLLGESVAPQTMFGFLVILAGFVLLKSATLKRRVVALRRPARSIPESSDDDTVVVDKNAYYHDRESTAGSAD